MNSMLRNAGVFLILQAFSLVACAAHPDCDGAENWAPSMAFVHLKNAGLLRNGDVEFSKTQVQRLASEDKGEGRYLQVHKVTFVKKDGDRVVVLTENLASDAECSEGAVTVYVVGEVLGGNG